MLRVYVCGAHSVGKTTLIEKVVGNIKIHYEIEVARKIIYDMSLSIDRRDPFKHPDLFETLQVLFIDEQDRIERINDDLNRDYIFDRGLDALAYVKYYLSEECYHRMLNLQSTKNCIRRAKESLVFVINPTPECIVCDGLRKHPAIGELNELNSTLQQIFSSLEINYRVIDFIDLKRRINLVINSIVEYRSRADI
ncbi:Uncharacterised protein g4439 [Pycnogonum litorale]